MRALLLTLFLPITLFAGGENGHLGGRSAGMAHASVTLSDVWSTHHNQAGLAWLETPTAGIFFQNKYLLKELSYMGFAYAHPIKQGTFGLSYSNFGNKLYGESKVGLAYGMKFSSKITGGIQINYQNTRIGNNYGSKSSLTAELGMQAYLNENFMLAVHLFNPTRSKLNDYNDERIPTVMRLGLSYKFSSKVMTVIEAEKDLLNNPIFKFGMEYKPTDMIYLRAGVSNNPTLASFGIGINLDNIKIDIATSYHQVLGFAPELSLNYSFGKKEKSKASI